MTSLKKRLSVILSRPQKPENIGLAVRAMKNTGFENLLVVGMDKFESKSYVTAVHSQEILDNAGFFPNLLDAASDKNIILASTKKKRKNFPLLSLDEAVSKIFDFSDKTKIGLLFGNEITGLTSKELSLANFHFTIPQFGDQPSYNLGAAVLLTLFSIYTYDKPTPNISDNIPLPWKEQEECIAQILRKLEDKQFIHSDNKEHVTERVFDLFGRLAMTDKDRKLLLAIFSKGPDSLK